MELAEVIRLACIKRDPVSIPYIIEALRSHREVVLRELGGSEHPYEMATELAGTGQELDVWYFMPEGRIN